MLGSLPPERAGLICRVIAYHNRAALPEDDTGECLFYTRLLRDADKLDIWRVLIDHYQHRNRNGNPAVELGLPDTPGISGRVYEHVVNAQIVEARDIRNLNDFKLLQIGWVFDINFTPALQQVKDRGYIESLCQALPPSDRVTRIQQAVEAWFDRKLPVSSANSARPVFTRHSCNSTESQPKGILIFRGKIKEERLLCLRVGKHWVDFVCPGKSSFSTPQHPLPSKALSSFFTLSPSNPPIML